MKMNLIEYPSIDAFSAYTIQEFSVSACWKNGTRPSSTVGADWRLLGLLRLFNIKLAENNVVLSLQTKPATLLNGSEYTALIESTRVQDDGRSLLYWAVDSAMQITKATKANLQILDPASGMLHIAAQRGFRQPFLDFFKCVHGGGTACGKAFDSGKRVMIEDVTESAVFRGTPALEVLLDARVRAVQSTPLLDSSGVVLAVLSTHWPSPRRMSNQSLAGLDALASVIARSLRPRLRH